MICLVPVQGDNSLDPPDEAIQGGQPVAIMRTLNEVEPRKPILSLPFIITNSGSFYLAASLKGCANSNGITIAAGDVRLDLSGFGLNGVSNSLNGIEVTVPCDNVTIYNGVVRNWNGFGILATSACDVALLDVKAFGNGCGGLYVGANSLLQRCAVYGNGFDADPPSDPPKTDGIQCGPYSSVIDCKARKNKGCGIHTYKHARLIGCTSTESMEAEGINAEDYCTVRDCVVSENFVNGIKVGSRCRVTENTCGGNGVFDTQDPMRRGAGIFITGHNNLIENNILCGNYYGVRVVTTPVPGGDNLIVHNSANNNTNHYVTTSTDFVGTQVIPSPGQPIDVANPWANFKF